MVFSLNLKCLWHFGILERRSDNEQMRCDWSEGRNVVSILSMSQDVLSSFESFRWWQELKQN